MRTVSIQTINDIGFSSSFDIEFDSLSELNFFLDNLQTDFIDNDYSVNRRVGYMEVYHTGYTAIYNWNV